MSTVKRIAAVTGVVAPLVGYGAILVATVIFPDFSWLTQALSHTGSVGGEYGEAASQSSQVFNTGLIVAGFLVLPYTWRLWIDANNLVQKVAVACFVLSALSLSGVGFFPLGGQFDAYHTPAALGHYLMFTFGLWLYGSGAVFRERHGWGLALVWLGNVHLLMWVLWAIGTVLGSPIKGLAIPEFVGALIFAVFLVGTTLRYLGVGPLLFE